MARYIKGMYDYQCFDGRNNHAKFHPIAQLTVKLSVGGDLEKQSVSDEL